MSRKDSIINGVLLLNKPKGITSHDAVVEVRRAVNEKRIGHAGTLDPLAEGLMIICIGRSTKIVQFLSDMDKTYEAEITLGRVSDTYDSEGVDLEQISLEIGDLTNSEIDKMLDSFRGKITQRVPKHSAVRVDGERLYNLARKNVDFEAPEREVEITELKLISYEKPVLKIEVSCSKGTYIRSLAHDIGQKLQCGAYLSGLLRTRVGKFLLEDALDQGKVEQLYSKNELEQQLLTYQDVLDFPAIVINDDFREFIINGKDLHSEDIVKLQGDFFAGQSVMLADLRGQVLAIGNAEVSSTEIKASENKLFSYQRVLN